MNQIDRILEYLESIARFCPICGKELVTVEEPILLGRMMQKKICPGDHGAMSSEGEYGADLVFRVSNQVFDHIN
jgi:hypothetical protein